jgi:hypothetical protein
VFLLDSALLSNVVQKESAHAGLAPEKNAVIGGIINAVCLNDIKKLMTQVLLHLP